jgi:hypothetical protein
MDTSSLNFSTTSSLRWLPFPAVDGEWKVGSNLRRRKVMMF